MKTALSSARSRVCSGAHGLFFDALTDTSRTFMKIHNPEKILAWLQKSPSLAELCARFPDDWEIVQSDFARIVAHGTPEDLKAITDRSGRQKPLHKGLHSRAPADRKMREALLSEHVRHRMMRLVIKQYSLPVATGVTKGKVRFDIINGYLAQKLLFAKGLERKMTSLFWFRLVWPLIWRKRLLMPLVESRGIYCFYSKELVEALAAIIGSRSCVEIAAGDGTLSRFLKSRGIQITVTDNHSWKHAIHYPEDVELCDAREALRRYDPEVVICSWPPSSNDFERMVFKTKSVQVYIVIGSRFQFASGNWADYKMQSTFSFEEDKRLGELVLPPELGSTVYIFRRCPK